MVKDKAVIKYTPQVRNDIMFTIPKLLLIQFPQGYGQSCNTINRIFTCRLDPEGTVEAESGSKEAEEAEEAKAVEVVERIKEGEIKEEP